jgi:hypothetical protein
VALAAAILSVAIAAGATVPPPAAGACPLRAGAAPVIQVAATRNHAPLALYALGFSTGGKFAWLERRVGSDSDDHTWLLRVTNLDNDRTLVEREYALMPSSIEALCARHGRAISAVLDRYQIRTAALPTLEQPDAAHDPTAVEFIAGRRNPATHKTPHRVVLSGSGGTKDLGVVWQVEADSGEAPLGKPTLAGLLRSPFEPRVVVLCRQQMVATEGVELVMIKVLGGRLDGGWRATVP